jgi:glycosyltransferase involved in cell wall biosynthesis
MSRLMGEIHDRITRDGHEVEYFGRDEFAWGSRGRTGRYAYPFALFAYAAAAARAGRAYDLINVHEPSAAMLVAWRGAIGRPAIVLTSHGVERRVWELALEEGRLGRGGPPLGTRIVHPLTSLWPSALGLRRADHIFCLSSEDARYLAGWIGRDRDEVTRIAPGAAACFARAAEGRDYARATRVLFAGTWRKHKGIEDLVPAFARLARRIPALSLTVLGPGAADAVVRDAFPPDVRERVHCVHPPDDAAIAECLARADLFVLPSLFEGTPLTLIEAMAAGLPIVTTATCGMRDAINDGDTGLLVPIRSPERIAQALARLLDSAELRARLGRAAHARAARDFTWERAAAPVRDVYERLLAARCGGRQ